MDGRQIRDFDPPQAGRPLGASPEAAGGRLEAGPTAGQRPPLDPVRWEALGRLHQTAANGLAESLTARIHHPVGVQLDELATTTTAQLLLSRRPPTCFAVLAAQPLDCRVLLEMDTAALYALFDWMLGGGMEPSYPPARPMTEIELLMAENVVQWIAAPYAAAWEHVLSLELALERLEHNPLRLRHLPALMPMMLARWSVRIGSVTGPILLAVPLSAIALMADKLAGGTDPPRRPAAAREVADIEPAV